MNQAQIRTLRTVVVVYTMENECFMKRKVLLLLFVLVFTQSSYTQSPPGQSYNPNKLGSIHDGKVVLWEYKNDTETLGYSLDVNRTRYPEIKAKYFADESGSNRIYNRFNEWKKNKNLITVFSGAFTDDYNIPIGITIDDGRLINRNIDDRMDALVIVEATGCIKISDLSKRNLKIETPGYDNKRVLDLRNPRDMGYFIAFAQKEKATVFQTQLLIFDDTLKVTSRSNALRERRLLLLARDEYGDLRHIVYNIKKSVSLFDISNKILAWERDKNIIALINLDTGTTDAMVVYDNGVKVSFVKGQRGINSAVNLLTYYE